VHTSLSATDPDVEAQNRKRNDIATALGAYQTAIAPNIAMLDADASLTSIGSGGDGAVPMPEAFALPPRPETAADVEAWLGAVYGPGGLVELGPDESWVQAITSMRYEDPGWGTGKVLLVDTSLPTWRGIQGQLLQRALHTTGSPLLVSYWLEAADGTGVAGGTGVPPTVPPGADGFFYAR
jgi:hypothetical protein